MPTLNARRVGYRKALYLNQRSRHLRDLRLGLRQIEIVYQPGWTKLKEYSHLPNRRNYWQWTDFAAWCPVEVVQQAATQRTPSIPRALVSTMLFRLRKPTRDLLVAAFEERGRTEQPGKKVSVERVVWRLIEDAANCDASPAKPHSGDVP